MEKAILELLNKNIQTRQELLRAKREIAKKFKLAIFENSKIIKEYQKLVKNKKIETSPVLEKLLRKRSIRTLSGIASVSVLTKPFGCPENCVYCPTEARVPKSYLSNEPAVMRAIRHKYDPYNQVQARLQSLINNGHFPTKIELIVIGGTWSALPDKYKYWYITECFKAANEYGSVTQKNNSELKTTNSKLNINLLKKRLLEEQKKNENAKYRIVGLTLETRPDWINEKELMKMREMGCTRVEIGVQIIDDAVLNKNNRGHGIKEVVDATKMLRDWGFKITYHWMPALPGSTPKNDIEKFKTIFTDERFQPDQIKFYPTVVTQGSLLYEWWKAGEYIPYSTEELENIITECKKVVPPYVRIIRLIRDIPGESIVAGNKITNLRQVLQQKGVQCQCIRCREPRELKIINYELKIIDYKAANSTEYFISYESKNSKLLGFCRLRIPDQKSKYTSKYLKDCALIRELHVYGELSQLKSQTNVQHKGIGKQLMAEAEKIIIKNNLNKIAIISGVGVRGYYRKLGYRLHNTYMVKKM
ncbi:tRNA uridine(34) 5-carboxymethylaminomethyl modification radical SAM/GNAT enzyme Elp3 [Patescibacteria group bacterium]|nr:tRNA uridine(34) 5-carboxymethylaminomethyl modification radical SAM/GNAT enzyme Elp3 [Patescibacteria group bacterium]